MLDWNVDELKEIGRKTRNQMTMNHALQSKADEDRLHVSRNFMEKRMVSIEECIRIEEHSLSDYI